MTVSIKSFAYKQGLPVDPTGNGGGFVFDCRAMPNPFWDESLRGYTGRDKPICDFFDRYKDKVDCFLGAAETLVCQSIDEYLKDGRYHLQVAFGCTGGQHRSVYFADRFAYGLPHPNGVIVDLSHTAWRDWRVAQRPWITICPEVTGVFAWIRPPCEESELDTGIGDMAGFCLSRCKDADIQDIKVPQPLVADLCRWMEEWYELERRFQSGKDAEFPSRSERARFDNEGIALTNRLAAEFGHLYRFRYSIAWGYCQALEESKGPQWIVADGKFG